MFLYLLERPGDADYDEYDSAVVVAANEDLARNIHPSDDAKFITLSEDGYSETLWIREWQLGLTKDTSWPNPKDVKVTLLGVAHDKTSRVVCASFNAG